MAATKVKRKSNRKQSTITKRRAKGTAPVAPAPAPTNEWFELRSSRIQGRGGFAIKDIPKGTRIIEYTGEKISNAEADRRYDDETMRKHHTFLFILNERTCVDAAFDGNESRFINHSCDPNCDAVIEDSRIWIETIRDVEVGEELAYDYAYVLDERHSPAAKRRFPCHCGSPSCRGTILAKKR